MKNKTIVSRIGMLAVIMALSMTAVTGCGSKSGDRTSDEVSSEENADTVYKKDSMHVYYTYACVRGKCNGNKLKV